MPWWLTVALFLATTAVSFIFRPRIPRGPGRPGPDKIDFPTSDEGRPIPIVWGTVRVDSPNMLWVYAPAPTKDSRDPASAGYSVSGYLYYMNYHAGLCMGEVDSVEGSIYANGTLHPDQKQTVLLANQHIAFGRVASPWTIAALTAAPTVGTPYSFQELAEEATTQMKAASGTHWKVNYGYVIKPGWNDTLNTSVEQAIEGIVGYSLSMNPGQYDQEGMQLELERAWTVARSQNPNSPDLNVDLDTGKIRFTFTPVSGTMGVCKILSFIGDSFANGMLGFNIYEHRLSDPTVDSNPKIITADVATYEDRFTFESEFDDGILATSDAAFTAEGYFGIDPPGRADLDVKTVSGDLDKLLPLFRTDCGPLTVFNLNAATLWGQEGGVLGKLNVYHGGDAQARDLYLSEVVANSISAFPRMCHVVFQPRTKTSVQNTYYGDTNYAKPITFVVKRTTKANTLGAVTPEIDGDCNPAVIIYDALTNPDWGGGVPTFAIDSASFNAVAVTLATEGLGMSVILDSPKDIGSFVGEILRHVDGVLYTDATTGLLALKLARDDYTTASLPLIDETNADEVKMTRPSWAQTRNVVKVRYTDRDDDWTVGLAQAHDLANLITRGNEVSMEEISFEGLSNLTDAETVATRVLRVLSRPYASFEIAVNRELWSTRPGAVCRLTWASLGITDMPIRIVGVNAGTLEDGTITLDAVEDVYGKPWSSYTPPT